MPHRSSPITTLPLLVVLLLPFACLIPSTHAQPADIVCPDDSTLTSFLLALIDTLYANGLTHYESLIAKASESDEGYELLSSWYTDESLTLFVPTDAAFQAAGIVPPFDTLSDKAISDTIALHAVSGRWDYNALPQAPAKGFADTQLSLAGLMNSTMDTEAKVPLVLQQGEQRAISVRLATGNATTWGWVIQGENEVWNVVIIPIDTVLPTPPKLSQALSLATTSRSTDGLSAFQKALDAAGGAQQLEELTQGGFTIFAPIDDAFTPGVTGAFTTEIASLVLGNHYATNYSLFSRIWVDNGPYTMPVVSGETLFVQQAENGATVTLGNQTVRILRSDVVLENGVMHIVEDVLIDPQALATATKSVVPGKTSSVRPSQSGNSPAQVVVEGTAGRQAVVGLNLVLYVVFVLSCWIV